MPEPFDPIPPHQHKIDIRFVLQPDGIEKMDTVTLHALMYHLAQDITSHCQAGVGKLLSIPSSTNRISFTKRYVFSSSTSSRTNMELKMALRTVYKAMRSIKGLHKSLQCQELQEVGKLLQ